MREPADGWLVRDGVRFHFLEWTPEPNVDRAPPVVLLHGLSSNARYWERLARHLKGRRLVALDQRGHGLTGRPPETPVLPDGYAMEKLLDDVAFAVAELELGKPVVVGHSWGATVALELVGTRPGLASGLVFVDGPVQSASNLFSWEQAQSIMQPPLPRFACWADAVTESTRDFEGAWDNDLESFVKARIMPDGDAFVLTLTAPVRLELLRGLYESQPDVLWPRVDVPAVALLAQRSAARISRSKQSGVTRLATIAPRVEVRWFDTPHDIPLFMPAEVASEVERIAALAAGGGASEATAG
ncbi:MAG TPA: alpha/beta fold hydrolase [Candidatus Dormibacteraeota bacterium]|nr:alpha/beta fold hydrolase [Candidatus Dormibacteraeota bacterium]